MMLTIVEHKSSSYAPRTWHNAKTADLTVAFAVDFTTHGEKLTHKAAGARYLGLHLEDDPLLSARRLYVAMKTHRVSTLNVAGNGIYTLSKHGVWQRTVNLCVFSILQKVHEFYPIKKIISGGQTGVDLAGGVAGVALGIDVEMTLPGGFRQRHEDGVDVNHTEAEIREQVMHGVNELSSL
jgi:hypothetical protein